MLDLGRMPGRATPGPSAITTATFRHRVELVSKKTCRIALCATDHRRETTAAPPDTRPASATHCTTATASGWRIVNAFTTVNPETEATVRAVGPGAHVTRRLGGEGCGRGRECRSNAHADVGRKCGSERARGRGTWTRTRTCCYGMPSPENSWRVPIPVQTQEPPCGTSAVLTTTCATTEALA